MICHIGLYPWEVCHFLKGNGGAVGLEERVGSGKGLREEEEGRGNYGWDVEKNK